MALENETNAARAGTQNESQDMASTPISGCPTWDGLGMGSVLPEFFRPNLEMKRQGFEVVFLQNYPRKETVNRFNPDARDLWFEIEHKGEPYTWTISQLSLLVELKRHEPLAGKAFTVRLIPVDEEFKKERPNYKGKDRYVLEPLQAVSHHSNHQGGADQAPHLSAYSAEAPVAL